MKRFWVAILLSVAGLASVRATAATSTISQLSAASALTGGEALPCDQPAGTRRCTLNSMALFVRLNGGFASIASSGSASDITTGTLGIARLPYVPANKSGDTMGGLLGLVAPPSIDNGANAVSSAWVRQFFGGAALTTNVQSTTGIPGIDGGSFMFWNAPISATAPHAGTATIRVDRHAKYIGTPQAGTVVDAISANCEVGLSVTNVEWCGAFVLDNSGQSGNNVAVFSQALMRPGATATWASVFEARDTSGVSDPSVALVSTEIDNLGTGTDANRSRVILDGVYGRNNPNDGTQFHAAYGIRVSPSKGDTNSVVDRGFAVLGNASVGLDLASATITGPAVALAGGQKLAFDFDEGAFTSSRYLFANGGNLYYHTPDGNNHFAFQDSGNFLAGAVTAGMLTVQNGTATCVHTPTTASETVSCSSDARLKARIADARSALKWLDSFKIREFDTKADGSHHTGVVAQELQKSHPEMVHVIKGVGGDTLSAEQPDPWRVLKAIQEVWSISKLLLIWNGVLTAVLGFCAFAFLHHHKGRASV